tara:strand:+ start:787 stop:996 length:210 start_codon:yes stop_codon:yes gene_type:complete
MAKDIDQEDELELTSNDIIQNVVRSYLRDNLVVTIEQDYKYSNNSESNFDVIVTLDGDEISKEDFTINH